MPVPQQLLRVLQRNSRPTKQKHNPSTATALFTNAIYLAPSEPSYHLHRAQSYLASLDFPSAIASFRQCLACIQELQDQEARMRRGLELLGGSMTAEAKNEEQSRQWPSTYVVTRLLAPTIYTWAQILLDERRFKESLKMLQWALDCEMRQESVLVRMALAHIGLNQFDEALEILYILTEMSPDNADYYVLRAKVYQQQDIVEFANIDYTQALRLNPAHPELLLLSHYINSTAVSYKNLASEQILKHQLPAAVHFLNHAVELDPSDWVQRFKRGAALAELRQYDGAIEDYLEVLQNPSFDSDREGEVKRHLASVYNRMGVEAARDNNADYAIKCFSRALEYNPKESTIFKNRADCHESISNIDDCLSDLAKALTLDPTDDESRRKCGELWFEIGEQAFGEGDWRGAVGTWTQAIHFDPYVAEYSFRRAKAFYLLQKLDEARHDAYAAVRTDPNHQEAQALYAELTTGAPPFDDLYPFPPQQRVKTAVPVGVVGAIGSGLTGKTIIAPLPRTPPPTAPNMLPRRTPIQTPQADKAPSKLSPNPSPLPTPRSHRTLTPTQFFPSPPPSSVIVAESANNILALPPVELPTLTQGEGGPNIKHFRTATPANAKPKWGRSSVSTPVTPVRKVSGSMASLVNLQKGTTVTGSRNWEGKEKGVVCGGGKGVVHEVELRLGI
ncbi:Tetratricopeptide repeat protein 16 [Rhizophlyctis rosea]|uniref:Tetratricopeptide repeat protein 16 n=1 Tax=Rhizophlyctis rosea TaxID=64517 RepID=A0AAD5S351_9FUNG|nr:Tetratricopeptide repeat protein 16 [Rhizophlyctis rosea]